MNSHNNSQQKEVRKIIFLHILITAFLFPVSAFSQIWQWAESAGGSAADYGAAIKTDATGNSYVTGYFEGAASFGPFSLISTAGSRDIFIAKYSPAGNVLWVKKAGSPLDDQGHGIGLDAAGNCYVTGYFKGVATFDSFQVTSSGGNDMFVAKYDTNGNILWVIKAGGTLFDEGSGISTDAAGNSIITGYFMGTFVISSDTLVSVNDADVLIACYDPNGNLVWAKQGGGVNGDFGLTVCLHATGVAYVAGNFSGTATFGTTVMTSSGGKDIFILKFNSSGNLLWAEKAGGSGNDHGFGISSDSMANCYLTGRFDDTATFGSNSVTSSGGADIYLAKYDPTGNILWLKQGGGTSILDHSHCIITDAAGNSYIAGHIEGVATFDSFTLTGAGDKDIFVAKYDANGSAQWAKMAGGIYHEECKGIGIDTAGNCYVTGPYYISCPFDSTPLISAGDTDIFVGKIIPPVMTGIAQVENSMLSAEVFPNPFIEKITLTYFLSEWSEVIIKVYDLMGNNISQILVGKAQKGNHRIVLDNKFSSGLYFLKIQTPENTKTIKLISN